MSGRGKVLMMKLGRKGIGEGIIMLGISAVVLVIVLKILDTLISATTWNQTLTTTVMQYVEIGRAHV